MANESKHMIHTLGGSKSFGHLSLKGKVLWPMLIGAADDQGRFDADAESIKWNVCQNVNEIALADVPGLLDEMVREGMLLTYGPDGLYGQIVQWWDYQRPNYARPSRLPAPDGWLDRWSYKEGGKQRSQNWDAKGGFPDCDQARNPVQTSENQCALGAEVCTTTTTIPIPIPNHTLPTLSSIWFDATGQTGSPMMAEEVDALGDEYGRDWVADAIKETVLSANRRPNVKYLIRVLERWKAEGKGSNPKWEGKRGKSSRSDLSPERIAQRAEFERVVAERNKALDETYGVAGTDRA